MLQPTLVLLLASSLFTVVCEAQVDPVGAALALSGIIQNALQSEGGIFIRTKPNDGCLDGGCCYTIFDHLWANPKCPGGKGHLKWYFDGPLLVVRRSSPGCMDCWGGRTDCNIEISDCHGGKNQRWHIKVYPENIKTQQGEVFFSIHSDEYSDHCMTMVRNEHGPLHYKLRKCGNPPNNDQLFYIDKDWISIIKDLQNKKD